MMLWLRRWPGAEALMSDFFTPLGAGGFCSYRIKEVGRG
jgi:hypothetical protein